MGLPITKNYCVDTQLLNQLVNYFQVVLNDQHRTIAKLKALIKNYSVIRYGRVRNANGGDPIQTADGDHSRRDNSFVRVRTGELLQIQLNPLTMMFFISSVLCFQTAMPQSVANKIFPCGRSIMVRYKRFSTSN